MENASKALIIAGAILLAILIISLGIMVYRQASDIVKNNGMEEVEVNAFNTKFVRYVGNTEKPQDVINVLETVLTTNATSTHQVKVFYNNIDNELDNSEINEYIGNIRNKNITRPEDGWNIIVHFDETSGYIDMIMITADYSIAV